jgi:hypothetical protein
MDTTTEREQNKKQNGQQQDAYREGRVARDIEEQTAKLPSDLFLWSAGAAIVASLSLMLLGKKQASNFVGQWAPTLLLLGVYNKIVKIAGHDRQDLQSRQDMPSRR